MDYSNTSIQKEANALFKENDPRCIQYYIDIGDDSAKSKLALIYLEGKCKQEIDIEKALGYSKNNPNYLARAVEAYIYLFIEKCSNADAYKYYQMLTNIHEEKPDHPMVNQDLSMMYLQGKIVHMDFSKAVKFNPGLLKQNIFNKILYKIPSDIRSILKIHIKSYNNSSWSILVDEFNKKDAMDNDNYSRRIDDCLKNKKYREASELSIEWFFKEKNEESAYHALRHGLKNLKDSEYSLACDILAESIYKKRNLKCLLKSAHKRKDWNRVEIYLSSDYSALAEYDYYRGCLEEYKDNIDLACAYYLKSVYYNQKTECYTKDSFEAIAKAFTLKPELILNNKEYADILISKQNKRYTYVVANALYDYGSKIDKDSAINLLNTISNDCYYAALKMYKITNEQTYAELVEKLKPVSAKPSYYFDYKDRTEIIETNYQSLPPRFKIWTLDELSKRYISGKPDVNKDYEKAKKYLLQEIDLCEENHTTSKFAKARLD